MIKHKFWIHIFFVLSLFIRSGLPSTLQAAEKKGTAGSPESTQPPSSDFSVTGWAFTAAELHGYSSVANAAKNQLQQVYPELCPASMTTFVVTGEASFAGSFELCGPITVLSAFLAAGGPSIHGSMRNISVSHDKTLLGSFDLYDYVADGRLPDDFVLNGGEVINFAARGQLVRIMGQVVRPGCYELLPDELNLRSLVDHARGIIPELSLYRIELVRVVDGVHKVLIDQESAAGKGFPDFALCHGDSVSIVRAGKADQLSFSIEGHVLAPQKIPFRRHLQLSDVLINEVHFKNGAALVYAELLREGGPDQTYLLTEFSPADVLSGVSGADLSLQPGDRLVFFAESFLRRPQLVSLAGAVKNPGHQKLCPGMTIKLLIEQGGGLLGKAAGNAELIRRNLNKGKLEQVRLQIDLARAMSGDSMHNILLHPFDLLQIP